jgi:hypothetical protein
MSKCSASGCEASLLCVCIYRCIHLKELAVCGHCNVTDAGIRMVIGNCNQLRVLNLKGLLYITGMCAVCVDPEPTLCSVTLFQQVHH